MHGLVQRHVGLQARQADLSARSASKLQFKQVLFATSFHLKSTGIAHVAAQKRGKKVRISALDPTRTRHDRELPPGLDVPRSVAR